MGRGRITVADGWGQAQLGGVVSVDHPLDPERLPSPGFAIVDANGAELPDGETASSSSGASWACSSAEPRSTRYT